MTITREEKIALLIDELEDIRCDNFDADTDEDKTLKEAVRVIKVLAQESKIGHWILQPSNNEQGERDFIWWKCSKCGQVIFSETEQDRVEYHAYCSRCGAKMIEPHESEVQK